MFKLSWLIEDKWPQKLFKRWQKGHKYIYQAFVVAWKFVLTENMGYFNHNWPVGNRNGSDSGFNYNATCGHNHMDFGP